MLNQIFLRRKCKIVLPTPADGAKVDLYTVATLNKNLESLGYSFDGKALNLLTRLTYKQVEDLYTEVVATLKEMKGVRNYRPMYPNFPKQVMDTSEAELYLNAIAHYFTVFIGDVTGNRDFEWLPKYEKQDRIPLLDKVKLTPIRTATQQEFSALMVQLMTANTSLSETDKADIVWAIDNNMTGPMPTEIPNKENAAIIGAASWLKIGYGSFIKTSTDVLRLAVALSGGDVSLAEPTKFRNFKRCERRVLLGMLNDVGNSEEMLLWKERWLRLGERLHPRESQHRRVFPHAYAVFQILRDNVKVNTFNSRVEGAIKAGEVYDAVELLKDRPGMLARRLDQLIRLCPTDNIIKSFSDVAEKVSTPVLLQVLAHFKARKNMPAIRTFFPKGNVAKVQAIPNKLAKIGDWHIEEVIRVCESALEHRFSSLPSLDRVYVDPALKGYLVPFSQRSASKALRTLVRGSRINLPEGDTLRFFLWWNENYGGRSSGRVDIDLSAILLNENFTMNSYLTYYQLKGSFGCHSGDITSAKNGASEFIDVSIEEAKKTGARYLVHAAYSYTCQPYKDLPECFVGWMMRQKPNSGEIFEPRTVVDKVDIASDTTVVIPVIFDLHTREAIWADLGLTSNPVYNNVHGSKGGLTLMAQAISDLRKPNLYDLLALHARGRGELVDSPEEATTVFSVNNGFPFEVEKIMSDFLA